jgi:hypothetical protein
LEKGFLHIKINHSKIPGEEWTWNHDESGHDGVNTFEHKLVWFIHSPQIKNGNLRSEQTFEDFIMNGPSDENVPTDIMLDLYELIINAMD